MRIRAGNSVIDYPCSTEQWPPEPTPEPEPPVPGEMSCSVSVNANNEIAVSYSDFPNVPNVNILRNGGFIVTHTSVTPGTGTYEDTSAVPGRGLFVCDSFTPGWWCGE